MYYGKANIYAKDAQYDKTSYKLLKWIPYTQTRGTSPNFGGGGSIPTDGWSTLSTNRHIYFSKNGDKMSVGPHLGCKIRDKMSARPHVGRKIRDNECLIIY